MESKKGSGIFGFTLLELIIAIAIIAILAAVAVPNYLTHLRFAEFNPTVAAANELQVPIAACVEKRDALKGCSSGAYGIPPAINATVSSPGLVVKDGVITATAPSVSDYGVAGATYILTPFLEADKTITWQKTGTACQHNYADC